MRIISYADPSTSIIFIRTPSEPIIAKAAMRYLCANSNSNWKRSIETFISDLLKRGAIKKGAKGELFSQLILTIVYDDSVIEALFNRSAPIITVNNFLKALFPHQYYEEPRGIDPDIPGAYIDFLLF